MTLQDVTETVLEKAIEGVKSNLSLLEAKNLIKQGEAEAALKRITMSMLIGEAVRDADYVQESVPDHYDFKKQVFREMDVAAPDHAILASSSSGLLMTEIQKAKRKPGRCVLVHPVFQFILFLLLRSLEGSRPLVKR